MNKYDSQLKLFVGSDKCRPALRAPCKIDGHVVACDGHRAISIPERLLEEDYDVVAEYPNLQGIIDSAIRDHPYRTTIEYSELKKIFESFEKKVFVCSMGDLFHESVPDEWIDSVFAVTTISQHRHTFLVLTKRPERMREYLEDPGRFDRIRDAYLNLELDWVGRCRSLFERNLALGYRNVLFGVTAENQGTADRRIPILCGILGARKFVSCEPLLGTVDLGLDRNRLDWVIVGGESGQRARPMHPDWVLSIIKQCKKINIPIFIKQIHINSKISHNLEEWPKNLRIREYPIIHNLT